MDYLYLEFYTIGTLATPLLYIMFYLVSSKSRMQYDIWP